ncbi:hypothetical protein ACE01N_20555 [Saccharicrinis sp. FJH2]|uniref:hypothetical protein n=1 Tax=Saccharicrinis sp. FJH65 TaxID=3344659 RepID=UPI0035F4DAF6
MRTYPENIEQLEKKHNIRFPVSEKVLVLISENIILRHDLAFLFLKNRILELLKERNITNISLDSPFEILIGNRNQKRNFNALKEVIPFSLGQLERSIIFSLLLFIIFIFPLIVFIMYASEDKTMFAFSFAYPGYLAILLSISSLLVWGLSFVLGRFFKNNKLPIDYRDLTINEFISKIISKNRQNIKDEFIKIFKTDIETLNEEK